MVQALRVDWVDTAKGICIVFVVMMHAVLGVEAAAGETGWMHAVIAFAAPFRMPDFFLISGLFLANVITRDWKLYLDRKVVHFAYFYVLWMTIQFAVKAPVFAGEMGWAGAFQFYLVSFFQPFGTLWFIYMLPIFFVVCKLAHDKGVPWQVMLGIAALLQIAPIHTGWLLVDEFASRFVYFYAGYIFAPKIFELAEWARDRVSLSLAFLLVWGVINGGLVFIGWSDDHLMLVDGSAYHLPRLSRAAAADAQIRRAAGRRRVGLLQHAVEAARRTARSGLAPTHLAVIFDHSSKSFRNDIYPDYKAHRPEPPEDLRPQFP
jgi:uncharacterized membrane protein YcfT